MGNRQHLLIWGRQLSSHGVFNIWEVGYLRFYLYSGQAL